MYGLRSSDLHINVIRTGAVKYSKHCALQATGMYLRAKCALLPLLTHAR